MRRLKAVLIAVVIALLPAAGLAAEPTLAPEALRGLLGQANEKFRQATRVAPEGPAAAELLYQESIVRFEKIIGVGNVRNGKLFYNLANAYLLKGDVGRAILNYRRAERLTPQDRNLRGNLAFARSQVRDSIPVPPERRVLDTVLAWHNGLPVSAPAGRLCACLRSDLAAGRAEALQAGAVLAAAARGDARRGRCAVLRLSDRGRGG